MSAPQSERVFRVFSRARELPPGERAAFLDQACGADADLRREVESLLEAEAGSGGFLEGDTAMAALGQAVEDADPMPGRRVGRYRVLEAVARGGMGVVYRAEQEEPRRDVALKLIRSPIPTPELRKRFEIEAQVLGRLQHPGIARIIEAGTADTDLGPQPFFAMEWIEGRPLTEHARRLSLPLRDRLELMIRVCEAVHHAHQKGVVHRDLKPANILVDAAGQPKVLDFGVARCTDPELQATTVTTGQGGLIGTLHYMSPEQVRGDALEVDTRSDVYALGVLCFELLTGELPHDLEDRTLTEAIRHVGEDAPRRLRSAGRRFPADLDTIVARALSPEREGRYGSASELAADLRRFLEGQPVAARPPSALYQIGKLVSRNRLAASLVLGMFLLLASFAAAMAIQASQIRMERDRAAREAATARQVSEFLQEVFRLPDPGVARGNSVTAREILDRGAARIRDELRDQPQVQARLMSLMGSVYEGLGLLEEAGPMMREALEVGRAVAGDLVVQAPGVARMETYASLLKQVGRHEEAFSIYEEVLADRERTLAPDHLQVGSVLVEWGRGLVDRRRWTEAEELLARALRIGEARMGPRSPSLTGVLAALSRCREAAGDLEEAEEVLRRALGILDEAGASGGRDRGRILFGMARLARRRGEEAEAERLLGESRRLMEEDRGADHPESLYIAAVHQAARGEAEAALAALRRALAAGYLAFRVDREVDLRPLRGDPELHRLLAEAPDPAGRP